MLSPNNDARKIREASRGLQTYIMRGQNARRAHRFDRRGSRFAKRAPAAE